VDHSRDADAAQHVLARVDAFPAVDAFDLIGRLPDINSHVAHAHTLLALDAFVLLVGVGDQQSVIVAEDPLQISVWADSSAEALPHQREIEKRDSGYDRAGDTPGASHVKRQQTVQQVARLDEIADEHKRQEYRCNSRGSIEGNPGRARRQAPLQPAFQRD